MEKRKKNEQVFHDNLQTSDDRKSTGKFHLIARKSRIVFNHKVFDDCRGKVMLDYGCNHGERACKLAHSGAKVAGIDISPKSLEKASQRASLQNLSDVTEFLCMDAERLGFPDHSFDFVYGSGIIHHLNLERSFGEIGRVLKESGQACFIEPLGHNPFINLYRKLTPQMRTVDEHPLLMQDLDVAKKLFRNVDAQFFHLFSLLAVPFRNSKMFGPLLHFLDSLDAFLFKYVPFARSWAWVVVFSVQGPRE